MYQHVTYASAAGMVIYHNGAFACASPLRAFGDDFDIDDDTASCVC